MILLDTNILINAHNEDSPFHANAREILKKALSLEIETCIAQQNLLEFFSAVTNKRRVQKPLTVEDAYRHVKAYLRSTTIRKISPTDVTLKACIEIAEQHGIAKADIFDTYLVATMRENSITTIYTQNVSDFNKYGGIEAIDPL